MGEKRRPLCVCLPLCSPHHISNCIILTWGFTFGICFFSPVLCCYPMLHQYLQSESACTWSPWCPGSPGGTHAFKYVCLDLCQGLVGGETKFAFSSVSALAIVYISMSNRPTRGEALPLEGEAVASGSATKHLNGPALVMLRVTESFFPCFCTVLNLHKPSWAPMWKAIWLIYLLSVEPFSIYGSWWKKRKSWRVVSGADRAAALAAPHTFLLEMIFWHLFTGPLKTRLNVEEPFRQSVQLRRRNKIAVE